MRNHRFETDFFEAAAVRAGVHPPDFLEEARRRLAKGGKEYGDDSWLGKNLSDFARELKEEGLDLAAWGALCAQRYPDSAEIIGHAHELAAIGAAAYLRGLALETVDPTPETPPSMAEMRAEHDRQLAELPE